MTLRLRRAVVPMVDHWESWCALTCNGGSEKKGCPCENPRGCLMREHPDFEEARERSRERLMSFLKKGFPS